MSVISNTTVLSNFASIERLDMLRQLYGMLRISVEVYDEILLGMEEGYAFYAPLRQQIFPASNTGWIHLTSLTDEAELRCFLDFPQKLHQGEASTLAIALHCEWLLLTDDLDARKAARKLGIRLSGSIGCLVLAVKRKLCSLNQANTLLEQMIREGYHSPVNDITNLL